MKKGTKLLMMPMCLLLCLGACTQQEAETEEIPEEPAEVYEVLEDDVEVVLEALSEVSLDTSVWKGFYFDNSQDEYVNYGDDWLLWESIYEGYLVATSENGFTASLDNTISYLREPLDEWSEYEYYNGTVLYGRYYGESSSMIVTNLNSAYFTAYPQLTIEYAVEQYTDFIGITEIMEEFGYYFSGSIAESDLGNTKYTAIIDAAYTYTQDRESIYIEGTMALDVIFDEEGNFTELDYSVTMYEYYDEVEYLLTQTLVCHDYLEDSFDEPEWVSTYF